jgi:hypothetical protein
MCYELLQQQALTCTSHLRYSCTALYCLYVRDNMLRLLTVYDLVLLVCAVQLANQEQQVRQEMIEYHEIEMEKLLKVYMHVKL